MSFPKISGILTWIAIALGSSAAGAVMVIAGVFLYLDPQIPSAATYRDLRLQTPLRIYAEDGSFIAEYGERRRIPLPINQVPPLFIRAVLDTEDKRFYGHGGIDFVTLVKSTVQLLANPDEIPPGASTITMQLARNISFTLEQTFLRKFKEMLLAVKIERELDKDEILELYLNVIPFGHRAYGAEAAALTYYGRPLAELDVAEFAMLAGIPQAPSIGNPVSGPERAVRRRNLVLFNMLEQGSIDTETYQRAIAAPNNARLHQRSRDLEAPWVAEWARRQVLERYGRGAYDDSFEVFTSVDPALQEAANRALRNGLVAYDRRHGYRGPERTLTPPPADEGYDEATLDRWARTLQQTPVMGDEVPALVLDFDDEGFDALLADRSRIRVELADMRWARPYLTVNSRGARPDHPGRVVDRGHLVRVNAKAEGGWRLGQVPEVQGALVAIRPQDGAIRAMVGGFDFRQSQFNNAIQAARQPGSAFKPFIYSAALEAGETAASIFNDAPLVFEDANLEAMYRPRNDSGQFGGPTRLRPALYRSVNLISMRVLLKIGASEIIDHITRFGFDAASFPRNLQLAIGGGTMALTPLDMARGYAVFANGGFLVEPWLVDHIDQAQETLFRTQPLIACQRDCQADRRNDRSSNGSVAAILPDELTQAPRVLDERIAYIMHSLLGDVIQYGTGRRARSLERSDLGGKTGTTNEADTWFAGYQPELAAVAWIGFADNRPLGNNEFGSNTALPVWIEFMETALRGVDEFTWDQPPGVVRLRIDPATGAAAGLDQTNAIFELFTVETAPTASRQGTPSEPGATPESIF
ncbi:MAG: PBP1A family penicillin-binding protein [Gammaproteobacteria bacterium]|nr:PBP1A family penicillin-binding protein [Gammaproteobacteria bacterium]